MTSMEMPENVPAKKKGKVLQTVLSLLIFAGFVVFLFVPKLAGYGTSLFQQLLDLFKGNFTGYNLAKISLYAVIGMYAVLLICTVAGLFVHRRGAAAFNFIKTFVAVAVMAFFAYAYISDPAQTAPLFDQLKALFYDEKTYLAINAVSLSLAVGVLAMIVLSIVTYKGKGVVKLVYLLLAAGFFAVANFKFVEEYTFFDLFGDFTLNTGTVGNVTRIVLLVFGYAMLANLALALLAMAMPHSGGLDIVRAAAMFLIGIAALIFVGIYGGFANLFSSLGTVITAGIALVQLIYTVIVLCVGHKMRVNREAEEKALAAAAEKAAEAEAEAKPAEEVPVHPAEAPLPEAAEEPVQESNPDADKANAAFEEAASFSFDDAPEEPAQTESAYDSAIRDEAEPAPQAEEPAFDFEKAKYDGNFNRQYADFVAQEEARAKQQQQQTYYGGAQQQQQQPYFGQQPYYGAQQNAPGGYYSAGFIPDAFISSLTPAERDEFDRLFISRIYGDNKRLPAYRIGGDNREFFTKIFVFMGRYRNVISDGLLEKIYSYSNSIR